MEFSLDNRLGTEQALAVMIAEYPDQDPEKWIEVWNKCYLTKHKTRYFQDSSVKDQNRMLRQYP